MRNIKHAFPCRLHRASTILWMAVAGLTLYTLLSGCASTNGHMTDRHASGEDVESLREVLAHSSPIHHSVADLIADAPKRDLPPEPDTFDSPFIPDRLPENLGDPLPTIPVRNFNMGREADIAVVLRALARGADLNLVIGNSVSGPILLSLPDETTWDRLFRIIVETHGLHYEYRDGLLKVMGREDVDRQIAMERALKDRERAREDRLRAEPLKLELYRVRYADIEALARSLRESFGGNTEEGSNHAGVMSDTDSGVLVLQAPPARMSRMLALARSLDQPARQILIEASIVHTNSETARDLGMQWGALYPGRDGGKLTLGTALHPDGWNANFPAGFESGSAGLGLGAVRASANQILQVQLTALQKEGRLHIVSSPSITTLDKQTAIIESGEERPFQTSTGTGLTATSVVEFKKALLSLEVTPHVIDELWIKLHIKTTQDDFDDSRPVVIDGSLQVPIITRSATTVLYLADGQTTVIGGLSTNARANQTQGVPFLKNIPGLGNLFKNSNQRNTFSDTLIFITPRILGTGSVAHTIPQGEDVP